MKQIGKFDIFKYLQYEYLFLVLGLVFGIMLVFVNPPFHTNDENDHFYCAYHLSNGIIIPEQSDGKVGGKLPLNLRNTVQSFQGVPFHTGSKIKKAQVEEMKKVPLNERNSEFFHNPYYGSNPISFIPHSAGIAIGRAFNSNPVWLGWFGRLGGLFCFLIIVYFAIKITPVFKSVFFLYGLTPMILYQAASVTYDMLSLAATFLYIAVVLKYALEKDYVLRTKDFIIIIFLSILMTYAKGGYPLIPFLFFLVPPSRYGSNKKAMMLIPFFFVLFILLYTLQSITWVRLIADIRADLVLSMKKDFYIDGGKSLGFALSHPIQFAGILFQNVLHFRHEWLGGCIGRFGYSYTLLPNLAFILHGLVLLTVALFDSKNNIIIKLPQKLLLAIVGFGTVILIIGGSYIFMSPVGANMIFGLQGRYFAHAVIIIALLLYNTSFEIKAWNKWGSVVLSVYMALFLSYAVFYLQDAFYSE